MTTLDLRPAPALLLLPLLLLACSDDGGGRETAGAVTLPPGGITLTSVSTSTADTTGDDVTPTTSVGTTSSGSDTTPDDPFATGGTTTFPGTTGFPGELGCSNDLHSVVDEQGTVIQECPSSQACAAGACVPACEAVADLAGTVGCDFWAPTPPFLGNGQGAQYEGPCFAVFLANAWNGPANITVSRGGQSIDVGQYGRIPRANGNTITYEAIPPGGLPPDEVAILFLSHRPGVNNAGNTLECPVPPALLQDTAVPLTGIGQAFHVTSDAPLSAYDINPYGGALSFLPSASLLFPASSWGTNHMAIAPHLNNQPVFALVVAREDNTVIKVAPASPFPGGNGVAPAPAGMTTQYVLNAGQILQWSQGNGNTFDPSAAIFDSDKPIGLWTGTTYLFVQSQTLGPGGGEAAHQQIAPVSAVGNEYVGAGVVTRLASLAPESVPYRIVGAVDGTNLTWDPAPPAGAPPTLTAGQIAEFETTTAFTVRSQDPDHPFLFSQYMTGTTQSTRAGCTSSFNNLGCGLGDEEWVSLLSPKQFQNRYIFFTDPTYGTTNLVIIRARGETGFADVTVECLGVVGGWMPVGTEGLYEYAHVDLERGGVPVGNCGTSRHLAESDGPFGIVVWGTDLYASYGYPAGSDISKINKVKLPIPL